MILQFLLPREDTCLISRHDGSLGTNENFFHPRCFIRPIWHHKSARSGRVWWWWVSTSKTIIIIPPLCMRCVYCAIWLISGVGNLWGRSVRLLLSRIEKGAERGLRFGFLSGRPRFAVLAAGTEREGRSKAKCCRGALGLSPRPAGAAAAGNFPTKERAWDAAGGQLGKRAGRVNTESSQGGVVCAELHLLSHILCCREMQKRRFSPFFTPPPSSFSFRFPFFPSPARFPPRLLRRGSWCQGWHRASPPAGGGRSGAAALGSCEPQPPNLHCLGALRVSYHCSACQRDAGGQEKA